MFAWMCKRNANRERGFTLTELVVVIAILGAIVALALPRYVAARKRAYKAEATNLLQTALTMQWSYYQLFNTFDTSATGANLSMAIPSGLHWSNPSYNGTAGNVTVTMSGVVSPLNSTDSVWIVISGVGTSTNGATF